MSSLPVVVGFGGINPAGRASFHHAYRRMVFDALPESAQTRTLKSLAALMNVSGEVSDIATRDFILAHTLIRKIEASAFDVENVAWNKRMSVSGEGGKMEFVTRSRHLPDVIPPGWTVRELGAGQVAVTVEESTDILVPTTRRFEVSSAGQLPSGFDPSSYYAARSHPKGLQMSVFAASDAIHSMGIDWEVVRNRVRPDQIGVYASSAMAQMDDAGYGGLLGARAGGGRVSSKQLPLGLPDMPADFVSAYVLGNVGSIGPSLGACATFFYNMRHAVQEIRDGSVRVAIVGAADAAVDPRVMDGYATMGALATDAELLKLDQALGLTEANYRRASRPFSTNCGFTISESSQFIVLFDDALAMELGAQVHGAVPDVFVSADGFKKSISGPGIGNYVTVAKALACAAAIVGDDAVKTRSFVQAHGTSTPQNRVTESHILNEVAKSFGIEKWPLVAVKTFLGHSIGAASGDQMTATLGVWHDNILPGITTADHFADDVESSNLGLSTRHVQVGENALDVAVLNAKGFGGNNASATVLSPSMSQRLLQGRHGAKAWAEYQRRNEQVVAQAQAYDDAAVNGELAVKYQFGEGVLEPADLDLQRDSIGLKGWDERIALPASSPYADWLK